jgi:hypothetical protein
MNIVDTLSLYKNEYRNLKLAETTIREGLGQNKEN